MAGAMEPTASPDAAPVRTPSIEEVRAAFPQFEVIELIGRGGMGAVFKARQPQLDRVGGVENSGADEHAR